MASPLARQRALEVLLAGEAPPMALGPRPLTAPVSLEEAAGPVEGVEMVEAMPPAPSEYERIQRQANEASLGVELGRAGAMLGEAISGARAPMASYDRLAQQAQAPVAQYLERRQAEAAAQKAEQESALRDPFSPESRRRQAAFQRANPTLGKRLGLDQSPYAWSDLESVIKGTLPVDSLVARSVDQEQRARDLALKEQTEQRRAGEFTATLEQRKAEALQRAKDDAARRGLDWAKLSLDQQRLLLDAEFKKMDNERATAKADRELAERNVGGWRFNPQDPPSTDAAKQMAKVSIENDTISPSLNNLERMYSSLGSEQIGRAAGAMESEWINITNRLRIINDMGVPNGNDYLMLAKQLEDPTELRAVLTSRARGLEKMRTLRRQVKTLVDATAKAYKYTPAGGAAPIEPTPAFRSTQVTPPTPQQPTRAPAAGEPSRPDRKLDSTKTEERRSYSKDGKWMKVYYTDGTYGLAPSDKR